MSIGCNRPSSDVQKLFLNQQSLHHPHILVAVLLSSPVGVQKNTSAYYLYKLNKSLELIEELQSTSVTPDETSGLLPVRKIAQKKTKAKRITQVCGSMRAKEMLSKVQEMKAQEKEKEEKRKKNAQKKGDIKIAFTHCKDKFVCDGKRNVQQLV